MSFADVSKALCDHVDTMDPTWETQRPNQIIKTEVLEGLDQYQRLNVVNTKTDKIAYGGTGLNQWDGFLQVLIFVKADTGDADANARADAIKAHFYDGLDLTEGATTVCILNSHIGKPYEDPVDPKWWITPVTVYYFLFT